MSLADQPTATVAVTPLDAGTVGGSVAVSLDLLPGNWYTVDSGFSADSIVINDNDLPTVSIVASTPNATESSGSPGGESCKGGRD